MDAPLPELRPGRFSDRFVAYLLDTLPFALGAVATVYVWGGPLSRPVPDSFLVADGAVWTGLAVLWQFAGNLAGGTAGHKLLGLRVVATGGVPPGVLRALARAVVWLLGAALGNFGFWVALFHPKTRTLHDMASGTFVVEDGPRRSDGALVFMVAAAFAVALFVTNYWFSLLTPTREDLDAILKAEEGLSVIAQIQEAHRAAKGTYATDLQALAEASGDVETFKSGMLQVFNPTPFFVEGGNRRWRVTAAAKDRRHTLVRRTGP
ncbi:MAG: RDD family protein [Elusimicrobia bacterium]|nr:RDD family protein [Elusimicrobiota bacterium]